MNRSTHQSGFQAIRFRTGEKGLITYKPMLDVNQLHGDRILTKWTRLLGDPKLFTEKMNGDFCWDPKIFRPTKSSSWLIFDLQYDECSWGARSSRSSSCYLSYCSCTKLCCTSVICWKMPLETWQFSTGNIGKITKKWRMNPLSRWKIHYIPEGFSSQIWSHQRVKIFLATSGRECSPPCGTDSCSHFVVRAMLSSGRVAPGVLRGFDPFFEWKPPIYRQLEPLTLSVSDYTCKKERKGVEVNMESQRVCHVHAESTRTYHIMGLEGRVRDSLILVMPAETRLVMLMDFFCISCPRWEVLAGIKCI